MHISLPRTRILLNSVLLVTIGLSLSACDQSNSTQVSLSASAQPSTNVDASTQKQARNTAKAATHPNIAVDNLNAQIKAAQQTLGSSSPHSQLHFKYKNQLLDLLLMRIQFTSSFADFKTAQQLVDPHSENAQQALINSKFYMATHQFKLAQKQLAMLDSADRKRMQISLNLAQGKQLNAVKLAQQKQLEQQRDFSNLTKMAAIEAELGNFSQAHSLLDEALENYNNTLPFPLAYIHFQQALMWGEQAGDNKRAETHYNKALAYLPQYTKARIHLAEIYLERDQFQRAEALLKPLETSQDPEVSVLNAEIYSAAQQPQLAEHAAAKAAQRYTQLLDSFTAAFSDHAAEFYLGVGQKPEYAQALALENLDQRKSQRAYALAIKASAAANKTTKLCQLVSQTQALQITNTQLTEQLQQHRSSCNG